MPGWQQQQLTVLALMQMQLRHVLHAGPGYSSSISSSGRRFAPAAPPVATLLHRRGFL
jgi:hypothetical protein